MNSTKEVKTRKPYIKPQLGVVSLTPKQTVLGACFSVSDPNPRGGGTCAATTTCMGS